MKTRIITAAVLLCIFIPVVLLSHTFVYVVFAAALALVGAYEMLSCMKTAKNLKILIPSLIYGVLTVSLTRVESFDRMLVCLTFIYFFTLLALSVFGSEEERENLPENAFSALMIIYITFGFSMLVAVRDLDNGVFLFPIAYASAWVSDTGAYFVGLKFGKRKLIPEISPKKTVEGFIGGIVSCVAVLMIYASFVGIFSPVTPSYFWIFFCAVILSAASVVGDLIASMIKRRYKIKDYSHIFPGHGGVLDRFDSILITAPLTYVLASITPLFN